MTKSEKIRKGDKFVCLHPRMSQPAVGDVIALTSDPGKMIGLEFSDPIGLHSCDGRGKDGYCIWVRPEHLLTEDEFTESLKAKKAAQAALATDLEEIVLRT